MFGNLGMTIGGPISGQKIKKIGMSLYPEGDAWGYQFVHMGNAGDINIGVWAHVTLSWVQISDYLEDAIKLKESRDQ